MKIAILTHSYLPKASGAEIFHHNLASRLSAAGHSVVVIVPTKTAAALRSGGWQLPYSIDVFPSKIWSYFRRWAPAGFWFSRRRLDALQKRHAFDVWHGVMMFPAGVALADWASKRGVAAIVRSAGDDVVSSRDGRVGIRGDQALDLLIRRAVPKCPRVVALSASIRNEFIRLGASPAKVAEIPNAVDLDKFQQPVDRETVRRRLGISPGAFLFLAVGRNHPQKNYPALLSAAGHLARKGHDLQILVVGRDTEKLVGENLPMELRGKVFATQVSPSSALDFPPAGLIELYRSADAFVMPSLLEGFSSALLEAMAAGLPVVTTDGPGCGDFVRQGEDALVVPVGEVFPLAEAMEKLLLDPELRRDYAARSLRRAAGFSWDATLAAYNSLYRDVCRECINSRI